ncbi:MAG TPA: metallophosphoesterase [Vicinamibacterales bacterium]|nr:metallophosphoesterase [Vicinamibacterales bacterium]
MRILHLADVHLDRRFAGLGAPAARRRRADLRAALERALALANEREVDLVTIGGDLWEDEHVTADTRRFVARAFEQLARPVLAICGNHDPWIAGGHYERTPWPPNVRICHSDRLQEFAFDEASVWAVSWTGGRPSYGVLETFRVPADGRAHVLLLHGTACSLPPGLAGDAARYGPFDPRAIERCGFALCLAGHIHHGQRIGPVVYPGSPEPLDWSETGRHAVALVEIAGTAAEVELVDINTWRYGEIVVDCTGVESSAEAAARVAAALASAAGDRLCLRVALRGPVAAECEIDPEAVAASHRDRFGGLIVLDETVPAYDLDELARHRSAVGYFVRDLRERLAAAGDERERRRLERALHLGLHALHGRRNLLHVE